jgi:hypothetical protein
MTDLGAACVGILRTSQLDCLLAYVQDLHRDAPNEVCVYLKNKLSVNVDELPDGRWQVNACHVEDPEALHVLGVGSSVRHALCETAMWIRAIILARGDLKDVKLP